MQRVDFGCVVVRVFGDLDLACRAEFRRNTADALPGSLVVVDLSRCLFCDSQGLLELFDLEQRAKVAGAQVRLAGVCPMVRRALELCGADTYLAMFPSVEAALNASKSA